MAKIKILKTTANNFGIFMAGRVCELPPNMMSRFAKETYEEVGASKESEVENGNDTISGSGEENKGVRGLSPGGKRSEGNKRNSD